MATSDNVIRAGLTPKLRDIPNLVAGLTYTSGAPFRHLIQPAPFRDTKFTTLYDPPIPEFAVLRAVVPAGDAEKHPALNGPSIAIVTEGKGSVQWTGGTLDVSEGDVLFAGAGTDVIFSATAEMSIYRAFVEAS